MDRSLLLILCFAWTANHAAAADQSPCAMFAAHKSLVLESERDDEFRKCVAKDKDGNSILSVFASAHPGVATHGFNFNRITSSNGRTFAWFSDRNDRGQSTQIARAFLPNPGSDFPVLMVWFRFTDQADFDQKAAFAGTLQFGP